MKVLSFLLTVIILHSCSDKEKKPVKKITIPHQTEIQKKISIQKIGELRFRMSYVVEGKTLNLNQLKKIGEDKQTYYYAAKPDTALLKKFQDLGLVTNNELLQRKFNSCKIYDYNDPEALFTIEDPVQKRLIAGLCRKDEFKFDIWISDSSKTMEIEIDGFYVYGLKFILLDIIPGGYKEVVILNDYYIANGDNSDLFIYQINYN
jgi:hypothetical protein